MPTYLPYPPTYLPYLLRNIQETTQNNLVDGWVDNMDGSAAKLKAANALRPTAAAAAAAVGPHPRRTSSSLSLVLL